MKPWAVVDVDEMSVHVLPVDDTKAHALSEDCWCAPRVEWEGVRFLIVHRAHDGREVRELSQRQPFSSAKPVTTA